ncbi:MAG: 4Fe-4S binding protein [Candidatus Aenigmarchaeota archaeon]|nr:4Fe-4S binding protein [Candidatus Aenigmarchaeota archaeon]
MSKVENLGVIAEPGSANKDKKSGWRTFKPKINEKCTNCGFCVSFCPEAGITIEGDRAKINYDYCKGCMICVDVCPLKAIEEEK